MVLIFNHPFDSNTPYIPHDPSIYDFIGYWDNSGCVEYTREDHLNALFRLVFILTTAGVILVFPDVLFTVLIITASYAILAYLHMDYTEPYIEDVIEARKEAKVRLRNDIHGAFISDGVHFGLQEFYDTLHEGKECDKIHEFEEFHKTVEDLQTIGGVEMTPHSLTITMEAMAENEKPHVNTIQEQLDVTFGSHGLVPDSFYV